jgi:hypothetical protein
MADSTAYIDTTSYFDATAYVYVDDSTSAITAAADAQAQSLVNDFDAISGPVEKQSKAVQNEFNSIINDISKLDPTDYTPEAVMDAYTQNALDQSYSSVKWQQGVDALRDINVVASNCSIINAASVPKYGDIARQISSMRSGVVDKATDAISKVASDIASKTGKTIKESAIGQRLSAVVNTGRSKLDNVSTSNSSPVGTILEGGKAGMAIAQSTISKLGPILNQMDKMINCVNSAGGVEYVDKVDGMIDKTNNIFGKMYLWDDPADPRYGEFNQGAFANAIPLVPKRALDNVFKATNMFNKSDNNANLSTDRLIKRAKEGAKSTSSLAPNNDNQSTETKRSLAEQLSQVKISVPKIPAATGRPAQKAITVTAPAPKKVATPVDTGPQEQPKAFYPYASMVIDRVFVPDSGYLQLDPDKYGEPDIMSTALDLIPDGGVENTLATMRVTLTLAVTLYEDIYLPDDTAYSEITIGKLDLKFERVDKPSPTSFPEVHGGWVVKGKKVPRSEYTPVANLPPEFKKSNIISVVKKWLTLVAVNYIKEEQFKNTFS